MATTFRPAERFGDVLTGRQGAAELRGEAERELARGRTVVFDFTGAAGFAPSFADELLAKLPASAYDERRVRIENLDPTPYRFALGLIAARQVDSLALRATSQRWTTE